MTKKKQTQKWVLPLIIISIVLIILIVTWTGSSPEHNQREQNNYQELETCPYECCLDERYLTKQCTRNYECINNKCNAIDSDGDGLTDIKEKEIGTNPQLYDTDGDTLNDYQEYNTLGTNPLKKNTDGDRYDDNEDANPLKKNSADVQIQGAFNTELNYINIGLIVISGGIAGLSPNLEIYSTNVNLEISNYGDDYTSGGSFDIVLLIGQNIIDTESFSFGKIEQNSVVPFTTTFSTKIIDIPSQIISLITQQATPTIEIKNLEYEKF